MVIKFEYDQDGDILEIKFSENEIADSEYIEESGIVMDYDEEKNLIGLEIISFSKRVKKNTAKEAIAI
ncbi:hypothetical protein BMS3Bbin03_00673 [bacterium BMS3Bbin03]|nr:hypothetical protein BMS3Bbin03_00673 [bacterium BMS3Bbin03]